MESQELLLLRRYFFKAFSARTYLLTPLEAMVTPTLTVSDSDSKLTSATTPLTTRVKVTSSARMVGS
jgi:hypothetical protein